MHIYKADVISANIVYRGPGDRYLVVFKPQNWRLKAKKSYQGPCLTNFLRNKYDFDFENLYFPYKLPETYSGLVITCTDKVILTQFNNSIASEQVNFTYNCHISHLHHKHNPFYLGLPYIAIPILSYGTTGNQWIRYSKNRTTLSMESKNKSNYCTDGFDNMPISFLTRTNKSSYCSYSSLLPNDNMSKLLFKYQVDELSPETQRLEFTINNVDVTNDLITFLRSLNLNICNSSGINLCKISFPDPIFRDKLVEISRNQ